MGKLDIVKLLVKHGLNLLKEYKNDQTVLDYSIANDRKEIAEFLSGQLS